MGAVFSLFAGFYYWYSIITSYQYNEMWAIVQFYLLFIGVNILAPIEYIIFKIILFDTRNCSYLNYRTDNNSIINYIRLTMYYLIAQLVEVKNIKNIHKASQRLNTKDIFWLI